MLEFLADNLGHFAAKFDILNVREDKVERGAGGLLLAMSVINEDRWQVRINLLKPTSRRVTLEMQHNGFRIRCLRCWLQSHFKRSPSSRPALGQTGLRDQSVPC